VAGDKGITVVRSVGVAAGQPEGNIAQLFIEAVEGHRKVDALKYKREGTWQSISHRELYENVKRAALGLEALGLAPGDRVAILSENRPEWLVSDFACVMSGLVSVPLYPTLPAGQLLHMFEDSQARAVFVSNADQACKVLEARKEIPTLEHVIAYNDDVSESAPGTMSLAALMESGDSMVGGIADEEYRARALATRPDDLLTILYTSGTTGRPKGVMLTHANLVSNVRSALNVLEITPDDVSLSALPLSHIFERMAGQYVMFSAGATICYAEGFGRLGQNFAEVRPTVMTLVPRVFEKLAGQVEQTARAGGASHERLLRWALAVGGKRVDRELEGRRVGPILAVQNRLADRLIFARFRQKLGGRIRLLVSGGAPLNPETGRFFLAAGLTLLEGYGLTETSPVISLNNVGDIKLGTVGRPLPGVEIGIADDGEVLTRGPHVMRGYHRMPGETEAAMTPDGWFRTGDVGKLDDDGRLSITDRKKDLIVTAGGKNIAPQPIENRVKNNRYVSQVVMVGDRRKFPVLLVVPDFDVLEEWAKEHHIAFGSRDELVGDPRVVQHVEREIQRSLSDLARFEQPKRIGLLPRELSLESGEATATLKLKRRVIEANYNELIERLYTTR
jgi:long-chain acyl-CoA synthetase